jgi:hypothetical protein
MGRQELDNLVKIGKLKAEPPSRAEYNGMLTAARTSLTDAQKDLDPDSEFTLAYGAAHRLALAALRREGYRSEEYRQFRGYIFVNFARHAHRVGKQGNERVTTKLRPERQQHRKPKIREAVAGERVR